MNLLMPFNCFGQMDIFHWFYIDKEKSEFTVTTWIGRTNVLLPRPIIQFIGITCLHKPIITFNKWLVLSLSRYAKLKNQTTDFSLLICSLSGQVSPQ